MGSRYLRRLTSSPYSTDNPVTAAYQAVRLEILAAAYEGRPEETWMIMNRLEIAYQQAGRPADAAGAHLRAVALSGRHGHAAIERWERSPRWFKLLTRRFRTHLELRWTEGRYLRAAKVIDAHLADIARQPRGPRGVSA